MRMFETFLASLPSNRSDFVNDLEIPDIPLTPYIWEPEPLGSDSISSLSTVDEEVRSLSTDSSLALSRAITDSEIDYDRYKRYKRMNLTDPWDAMRLAMAAFPPEHLASLSSFPYYSTETPPESFVYEPLPRDEEFLARLERLYDECRVFESDDPGLLELEEALQSLDLETLYTDLSKLDIIL